MSIKYLCGIDVDNGLLYTDTANDRVGIGTTSPSRKLQVIGTDGAAKFYYNSSFTNAQYSVIDVGMMTSGTAANGFGPKITFRMGGNGFDGFAAGNIGTIRNGADGTHNMTFATSTSNSLTTKMTITNSGDVGIGTTGPGAKLDVVGTIRTTNASGNQASLTGSSLLFPDAATTTIGANVANFNPGTKNLAIGGNSAKWNAVNVTSNTYRWTSGGFGNAGELNISSSSMDVDVLLKIEDGVNIENLANATSDTDKFLVSDPGQSDRVKYRTGAQLAADIGAVTGGPFLPLAGGTMTGDARFNDNVYARFGATGTGDLIIGHADFGSPYSVILENGSGDLKIQATNLLLESANGETYIDCNFNGSVDLYHNNVKKFETLSTGATVTGKLGIDTTSPNAQLDVFNNNDQTSTLRLSTSGNSAGDVSGEISFAFDGTTVGAKIQSVINGNEDGTDLKLDCANTTLTGNIEASGYVKAVDGYKGYVSDFNNGGFFHSPRSTDGANPLWIPINITGMSSSDQYYNTWVPLYAGRVRKIILKYISGSTPVATACTFRKKINGTLSSTTYAGTVTNGGTSSMKVTFDFGTTNFTFNAEDKVQIGVVTGVATQPRMGGMAYQIWYEYNIT